MNALMSRYLSLGVCRPYSLGKVVLIYLRPLLREVWVFKAIVS